MNEPKLNVSRPSGILILFVDLAWLARVSHGKKKQRNGTLLIQTG